MRRTRCKRGRREKNLSALSAHGFGQRILSDGSHHRTPARDRRHGRPHDRRCGAGDPRAVRCRPGAPEGARAAVEPRASRRARLGRRAERGDRARARRLAGVAAGRAAAGVPVRRHAQHLRRSLAPRAARASSPATTRRPRCRRKPKARPTRSGRSPPRRRWPRSTGCSRRIRSARKIIAGLAEGLDGARHPPALRLVGGGIRHGAQADAARAVALRPGGRVRDEGLAAACRSRTAFGRAGRGNPRRDR